MKGIRLLSALTNSRNVGEMQLAKASLVERVARTGVALSTQLTGEMTGTGVRVRQIVCIILLGERN